MKGYSKKNEYDKKEVLEIKPACSHAFGGGVDSMCLAVNRLEGINNLSTLQERYILTSSLRTLPNNLLGSNPRPTGERGKVLPSPLRTLPNKIRTIEDFMRG